MTQLCEHTKEGQRPSSFKCGEQCTSFNDTSVNGKKTKTLGCGKYVYDVVKCPDAFFEEKGASCEAPYQDATESDDSSKINVHTDSGSSSNTSNLPNSSSPSNSDIVGVIVIIAILAAVVIFCRFCPCFKKVKTDQREVIQVV